ncbi:unnamed protein product [Rotaria socialis]|uniref:Granulins domain-containing protein n=1 Tax=Rotaria socialis TaxID=392032 RepID=A0A818ITT9_9BILA|nr:unnamed protein product [Rotaria socialis]
MWFIKLVLFVGILNKYSNGFYNFKYSLDSISIKTKSIPCPDKQSYCPDNETCCLLSSGQYGCCPLPDAVCCNDNLHCCPNGYTCDVEHSRCQKGFVNSYDILCPDRYSCDESGSRCIRHLNFIEKQNIKSQRLISLSIVQEQICPDEKTICSLNSTCCPNKNEQIISYSCCPYSNGTCCGSNGSFCCPYKYICDEKQLTCQLNKTIHIDNQFLNKCGSSNFVCQFNQTCCKTSQSTYDQYACCDFPHAVCCDDGQHCCPMGAFCDNKSCGCITS